LGVVGTADEIAQQLEEGRRRWGFSYVVIHEREVDSFAPIVAALSGR
jgi:isopenicillin N synthase-like dioxygenase